MRTYPHVETTVSIYLTDGTVEAVYKILLSEGSKGFDPSLLNISKLSRSLPSKGDKPWRFMTAEEVEEYKKDQEE